MSFFFFQPGGPSAALSNLPEVIKDLGYQFTGKAESCRQQLGQLLLGQELHAHTVARIIGEHKNGQSKGWSKGTHSMVSGLN